jgi:hypothetical protein
VRFLLLPEGGSRPSLIVETRDVIDVAAIASFRALLYGMGCANGILFDQNECVILRDTFASMNEDSITVEGDRLRTAEVLARVGASGALDQRVSRWLGVLSTHWDQALPDEPRVAAPFIADIVPAASGSLVHAVGAGASG